MPNKKRLARKTQPRSVAAKESDSAYVLKLVLYFIFGSLWIHLEGSSWTAPIPVGFIAGVAFASHDHFQIDRKIEYAVLIISMFVTYLVAPRLIILL